MIEKHVKILEEFFTTKDLETVTKLISHGFKLKIRRLRDHYLHKKQEFVKDYSLNLSREGVSVRMISSKDWQREIFVRSFTGGYEKIHGSNAPGGNLIDTALNAKAKTIIRKNNIPEPHKLPALVRDIEFEYDGPKVHLTFPHNIISAEVKSIVGIKANGSVSEEVIDRPGEDTWFSISLLKLKTNGKDFDILYKDGTYYSCVQAREGHSYCWRISPDEIDITGNDSLLVKAAVEKYMEIEYK